MFVSQILGLKNFWTEKLQMTITFDREIGLRHFKNESFSKLHNEASGPYPNGIPIFFFKIPSFSLLFYFFYIFFIFLDFRLLFHLFILVKKLWKLIQFFFECIGDLSKRFWKNFEFFFYIFFLKTTLFRRLGAPKRHNRVDIALAESHNRRNISFRLLF